MTEIEKLEIQHRKQQLNRLISMQEHLTNIYKGELHRLENMTVGAYQNPAQREVNINNFMNKIISKPKKFQK